jgi:hypothetical protein
MVCTSSSSLAVRDSYCGDSRSGTGIELRKINAYGEQDLVKFRRKIAYKTLK